MQLFFMIFSVFMAFMPAKQADVLVRIETSFGQIDLAINTKRAPVTAANFDQTDGYVLLGTYGSLDKKNAWLVGYYYARIETFAVNNSYAQDDWVRWGSASQTRSSDLRGHEFRFGWAFDEKMNLLTRVYIVDALTSVEDGSRARVDFNYRF